MAAQLDKREQILVRLLAVLKGIVGVAEVYRNKDEVPEAAKPAIVLLDGNEATDVDPPSNRPPSAAVRLTMTPEVFIFIDSPDHEAIGTSINDWRAKIIWAVLHDAQLLALVGTNGKLRYVGCETATARGRRIEGQLLLKFEPVYVLRPQDLAAAE